MHNVLTQSQVMNSAYKVWKQSGSKELFASWLYAVKANGKFWLA